MIGDDQQLLVDNNGMYQGLPRTVYLVIKAVKYVYSIATVTVDLV